MAINLSKEVATIILMRFFAKPGSKGTLVSPRGAYFIAEIAEIAWIPVGKTRIRIIPNLNLILELDRTHVIVLEPYVPEVNACFVVLKPFMDTSLTLLEHRLLSRVGIDTTKLN